MDKGIGFNSTMVRLKVTVQRLNMRRIGMFQFHNGSIKRG